MKEPLYSQKTSFNKMRILKYTALAVAVFFTFSEAVYAADVTIQWDTSTDIHVACYCVYYDTDHPGPLYRGSGAREGNSPIYVFPADDENPDPEFVEYTIHDLPDGKYYFAVTVVNDISTSFESGYSNEVSTVLTTDTAPPYTVNHDPVPGVTGVSVDTLITLEVRDAGVGVDPPTIFMWVNGLRVNPSISGDSAAYILSYDPTEDFAYGQSVSVEVDASDLNGNAMMEADFYTFTTTTGGGGGCFISALGQG